jgi:hypothetical protein
MNSRSPRFEKTAYLIAFLLAVGLRFIQLGDPALTDSEATLALQSLHLAQGLKPALGSNVAYVNLTGVLFFIFGSSNFLARFWPALAGSALVFVPWLFRERLKARPAIILAFFLAIDPALVFVSRTAGSSILAVTGLLFAAAFWQRGESRRAGVFAALALLGGPSLWAGLLGLLLTWMIAQGLSARAMNPEEEPRDTDTSTQVDIRTQETADATSPDTSHLTPDTAPLTPDTPDTSTPVSGPQSPVSSLITASILTLLVASTLLLLVPQGLGAWLASIPEYIHGWITPSATPPARMFLSLAVYQPFGLLLATIAILRGWANGSRRVILLSLWALIALLLAVFHLGRAPADLVWFIIPLWSMAAIELNRHLIIINEYRLETIGVILFTVLLVGFAWLDFVALPWTPMPSTQGTIRLILLVGSAVVFIVSIVLVGFGWSDRIARAGAAWGLAALFGVYTLGAAWGATGLRTPTGVELFQIDATIAQADLISQTADDISEWATGHADDLPVLVFGVDSPALLWALRNHNPQVVTVLDPASAPELVITPPMQNLGLAASYRGQDFIWRQTPVWDSFSTYRLRWLTLRELPQQQETILLWGRDNLFLDAGE